MSNRSDEHLTSAVPAAMPQPAPERESIVSRLKGGQPMIEVRNLVKNYGRIEALRGVSLAVDKGEIFGLLGQNGAGKTTMIKILLGIIRLSDGEASLMGQPAGTVAVRKQVGYLPEDHRFPDYHSGYSLLDFYGTLLEMNRGEKKKRILEMLEFVGLGKRIHSKIRTYSKGMKQRLGIAQAIFHDPQVIFFDEPTDGVDPVGRRQIRDLMIQLKNEGKTIFLNSHLLLEVELVCDRVAIIHGGEMVRQGSPAELTKQRGMFLIGLAEGQQFPKDELVKQAYHVTKRGEYWEVALTDGQSIDPVVDLIRAKNLNLRHLEEKRQTLEDIFLETVVAAEPSIEAPVRRRRPQSR